MHSEVFIVLRSMKTVILTREIYQLRAVVLSEHILNILSKHEMHPGQAHQLHSGWPQVVLINQYRMYPGAADLPKEVFYPNST